MIIKQRLCSCYRWPSRKVWKSRTRFVEGFWLCWKTSSLSEPLNAFPKLYLSNQEIKLLWAIFRIGIRNQLLCEGHSYLLAHRSLCRFYNISTTVGLKFSKLKVRFLESVFVPLSHFFTYLRLSEVVSALLFSESPRFSPVMALVAVRTKSWCAQTFFMEHIVKTFFMEYIFHSFN